MEEQKKRNYQKSQSYYEEGRKREIKFGNTLVNTLGGNYVQTDSKTDSEQHIDIIWNCPFTSTLIGFDVKGPKNERQKEGIYKPDETLSEVEWIEFQNVQGQKGWIYGNAHYIAFECPDDWLIINRIKLFNLIVGKIIDTTVTDDRRAFFRYYSRKAYDRVVKVPTSFIRQNADKIIIKKEFLENFLATKTI